MTKKVVVYLRVSHPEQDLENQLEPLQKWISSRGYELVEVYQESESAWRQGHQRELRRLISELPRRRPEICLVWSLDRLTREGIGRILELVNEFKAHRCQVISVQESWTEQTAGPMGDLLFAITAWVAEFESGRRSERTLAGLARAKAQGKVPGRRPGCKDKRKRSRRGYFLRYAK